MKKTWFFATVIIVLLLSSISLGYSGGNGSPANPFQIANANDLNSIGLHSEDWDKCFIQTADIDLEGQVFTAAIIAPDTNPDAYFQGTAFTGTFDGNGHKISNLIIDGGSNNYIGLFGKIDLGSSLENICIEICAVSGGSYIGGLVGRQESGLIAHCYSTGSVTSNNSSFSEAGGLVGLLNSGSIIDCYSTASVASSASPDYNESYAGGLVGWQYGGMITGCHSTGPVESFSSCVSNAGGLMGAQWGGTIINCYSTGSAASYSYSEGIYTLASSYAGGLVGYQQQAIITNCCSTGSATATAYATGDWSDPFNPQEGRSYSEAGGLVGYVVFECTVSNCYSTGAATSYANNNSSSLARTGGLVSVSGGDILDSFWDMETSNEPTSAGGTGKTTEEMQTLSTFTSAGWDFTNETANGTNNIWRMCEDGIQYPILSWMAGRMGDFACPDGVNLEDVMVLAQNWLTSELVNPATFNYACDANGDGRINQGDFSKLGQYWPGQDFVQSSTVGTCVMDFNGSPAQTQGLFPDPLRFNVTIQGQYILFEDMVLTNCCKDQIQLKATAGAGEILLKEQVNISGWCTCICEFPVEAVLGPFEPGQYVFTVIQSENNEYEQVIGEIPVVIE